MIQVEINGVKMEVDTRYAKRIDTLTVGSRVKVLVKSYSDYRVYAGVIIGFDMFKELPTVSVAYIDHSYGSKGINFVAYNAQSKDVEIVADIDFNALEVNKADILNHFDSEMAKKQLEMQDLKDKRQFFIDKFGIYFNEKEKA